MFKATITIAVSAVKSAVRDAEDFGGSLHFQLFALDSVHHTARERFLPELLSTSRRQVIVHLYYVSELFGNRQICSVRV